MLQIGPYGRFLSKPTIFYHCLISSLGLPAGFRIHLVFKPSPGFSFTQKLPRGLSGPSFPLTQVAKAPSSQISIPVRIFKNYTFISHGRPES